MAAVVTMNSFRRGVPLLPAVAIVVLFIATSSVHVEARGRSLGVVPRDVSIVRVVASGSGCPATTPAVTISADKKAVTIPFTSFEVAVPAASPLDKEKSCTITIDLRYPAGWSYVGSAWTYQGWVELDKNLVAHQSAKYYYQGGSPSCYADHAFYGGINGLSGRPYSYRETCGVFSWSPCGEVRGLNVITRVSIENRRNPRGSGVIKSEAIDGEFVAFVLGLNWKYC